MFYIISFLAFAAGAFILLDINPASLFNVSKKLLQKFRNGRNATLKQQIKNLHKKEPRGIVKIIRESRSVLELTHRSEKLPAYTLSSIILFIFGCIVSIALQNYFLLPVLSVGCALIPWFVVLATATKFKRRLNDELETSLSMITTSYLRSDNIIAAIRENVGEMHYPVKEVFEKFLVQSSLISSNISALLEDMKQSVGNDTFKDWVDQLILCQSNRTLKSTLQPIVARFSEVREVSGELDSMLYEPLKEFISMATLTILNYPLFKAISPDLYRALMYTTAGQIIMAVTFVTLFISFAAAIRNTRPVEFRR